MATKNPLVLPTARKDRGILRCAQNDSGAVERLAGKPPYRCFYKFLLKIQNWADTIVLIRFSLKYVENRRFWEETGDTNAVQPIVVPLLRASQLKSCKNATEKWCTFSKKLIKYEV